MDPIIDRAAVLDRVGDDEELLREITAIFLTEYPSQIAEIRSAIGNQDAKRLERTAHSLKGSVSNFGAQAATSAAYRLEKIGRAQEMAQAPEAFDDLVSQFQRLRPELEALSGQGAIVASFTL
jgi:HPt (histidine-containing phosphotransfer) domain-containing protein